jgi:TRAM1-like protein
LNINLVSTSTALRSKNANFFGGIALNLIGILLLLHVAFPGARYYTQKFTHLSYHNENSGWYAQGRDDAMFVCFWVVFLSGLRAGVIDYILIPLAAWAGIEKKKAKVRFAEQAWLVCHHGTSLSCGMVRLRVPSRVVEANCSSTYGTIRRTG